MKIRLKCKLPDIEVEIPNETYTQARDEEHFNNLVSMYIGQALDQSDLWAINRDDIKAVTREFKRRKKEGRV